MTLSEYMRNSQLDDEAMASLLGCSAGAVKKWRYGERVPRPDQLKRIAEVTGHQVTANDFHGIEPAPEVGAAA